MNTVERTRIAFQRGTPDRVPIHCWLGMPLIDKLAPAETSVLDLFESWIDDPMDSIVKMQQDLGLDPMITTYSQMIGEMEVWPRMLMPRPNETDDWVETIEEHPASGWRELTHRIRTPDGDLDYTYRVEKGFGTSCHDYLLDGNEPEKLLPAVRHFPSPELYDMSLLKGMVDKVGDSAWWLAFAARAVGSRRHDPRLRQPLDGHLRPARVRPRPHALLHRLAQDATTRSLGKTGIHSICMDDTWVGAGLDPAHYREFIKPYDVECVEAAHDAGYLVSLHVCGRASLLLEDLADTGPDAIETLTSNRSSGDVDLANAKRRVGDRVCLFGGFNEHLLYETDADGVREEVKRCIDAAMEGGGYIFRSTGQIFDSKPGLIEVMGETARDLGRY